MSEKEENQSIPKFLEGKPLPEGYFDPVDPYKSAPSCNIDLGKLAAYAKKNNKTMWELTADEVKMFETQKD